MLAVIFAGFITKWAFSCSRKPSTNYDKGEKEIREIKNVLLQLEARLDQLNQTIARVDFVPRSENSNRKSLPIVQDQEIEHGSDSENKNVKTFSKAYKAQNEAFNNISTSEIVYSCSEDCEVALKDEISKYLHKALDAGVEAEYAEDGNNTRCDLLLYFDLVDDRIRNVEQKRTHAADLLEQTANNSVWIFICFKPTTDVEGTKIQNSVSGFPSGYTSKDGKFTRMYLTFEYFVKSSEKDRHGNFKHLLANENQFVEKMSRFVLQCKQKMK